jgi:hypothetical protein
VEAFVSLFAAWMASSPVLLAFGGDSMIELLSAVVVLWRFRAPAQERSEKQVARIAGALLFMLAAYVTVVSAMTLLGHLPRDSDLDLRCCNHALACQGKAEAVCHYGQCRTPSGCRGIRAMCLPFRNRSCRPWNQRDLAPLVGRPDRRSCDCSANLMGRTGSHARQSLWLLLILAEKIASRWGLVLSICVQSPQEGNTLFLLPIHSQLL